jgi:hypothetical protein
MSEAERMEQEEENMEIVNELKFMDHWNEQLHTRIGSADAVVGGYGMLMLEVLGADMALLSATDDDGYGDVVLRFMFVVYGICRWLLLLPSLSHVLRRDNGSIKLNCLEDDVAGWRR